MSSIIGILIGIWVFRLTLKYSNYFIAPREHWRKSRFDIQYMKISVALSAGAVAGLAIAVLFN